MIHIALRRPFAARVVAAALSVAALVVASALPAESQTSQRRQAAAQAPPHKTDKQSKSAGGGQLIAVLVNDEPVTGYEIEQRAAFLALNAGTGADFKAKAEARWVHISKDPKTNERFQQLLKDKGVRSREEAQALQAQFVKNLQRDMIEQLKRETRNSQLAQFRKQAQEELIEERLKLQEAKRLGIDLSADEVNRVLKGIAERNKMTEAQFADHLKSMNIDISTMRERFRAIFAWREVIRRRFGALISVNQRDIDRAISATASETGEDMVELQVQKITLLVPGKADQAALAKRYTDAEAIRRKYAGCKSTAALVKEAGEARLDELKFIKPQSVPEPTRTLLLSAKDGDMLPPSTAGAGIEIYTVCGRRAVRADDKQREKTANELQQHEFEILAKRHLRDLRQDAHIEYR